MDEEIKKIKNKTLFLAESLVNIAYFQRFSGSTKQLFKYTFAEKDSKLVLNKVILHLNSEQQVYAIDMSRGYTPSEIISDLLRYGLEPIKKEKFMDAYLKAIA